MKILHIRTERNCCVEDRGKKYIVTIIGDPGQEGKPTANVESYNVDKSGISAAKAKKLIAFCLEELKKKK